jgi:hypothetical protein
VKIIHHHPQRDTLLDHQTAHLLEKEVEFRSDFEEENRRNTRGKGRRKQTQLSVFCITMRGLIQIGLEKFLKEKDDRSVYEISTSA